MIYIKNKSSTDKVTFGLAIFVASLFLWNTLFRQEVNMGNILTDYTRSFEQAQQGNIGPYAGSGGAVYGNILDEQVLGTGDTYNPPAPGPSTPSAPSGPSPEDIERQRIIDEENRIRSGINAGWDAYGGQLDAILNEGLPAQQAAQTGIAQTAFDTGTANLGIQEAEGQQLLANQGTKLEKNQSRSLRDLSSNLRNMFMAGNVMLGARGAGDSSAANQYSYALQKLGTRARSDVMSQTADLKAQIDERAFKLKNIFDTETNNLKAAYDTQVQAVAQWFAEQQNQLRTAKAEGALGRTQDLAALSQSILDRATQALQFVQTETSNRRSALESWALSNSQTIQEARNRMGDQSAFAPQAPQAKTFGGTPTVDAGGNITTRITSGGGGGIFNQDEENPFTGGTR